MRHLFVDCLLVFLFHIHPRVHSIVCNMTLPIFFQGKKKKRKREKLQESASGRHRVTVQSVLMLLTSAFEEVRIFYTLLYSAATSCDTLTLLFLLKFFKTV